MSLHELMRQREEKLAQWRALGVAPYAYRYEPTHHAAEVLAWGEAVTAGARSAGARGGPRS